MEYPNVYRSTVLKGGCVPRWGAGPPADGPAFAPRMPNRLETEAAILLPGGAACS
jgi:hypothetical protein